MNDEADQSALFEDRFGDPDKAYRATTNIVIVVLVLLVPTSYFLGRLSVQPKAEEKVWQTWEKMSETNTPLVLLLEPVQAEAGRQGDNFTAAAINFLQFAIATGTQEEFARKVRPTEP